LNTSPPEAEEIFIYGMSEDEDNSDSNSDSDDTERNIVANTIQAERGGGAFVLQLGAAFLDPEQLGLASLEVEADSAQSKPTPAGDSFGSPPRMLSPLIAQLNPFAPSWADTGTDAVATEGATTFGTVRASGSPPLGAEDGDSVGPGIAEETPESHPLLVEMGELVCRLQQRRSLRITSQEASPEDLLARLAHFRELAHSSDLRPCA